MITHRQIAARFKGGASVSQLAVWIADHRGTWSPPCGLDEYVEHAIRQVMLKQERKR